MAERRRNLTEREIVERAPIDLSNLTTNNRSGAAAEGPAAPIDAGGSGDQIGVPTNFRVVSQKVVNFDGEYRVHVTIEFDAVAGATEYEPRLNEVFG